MNDVFLLSERQIGTDQTVFPPGSWGSAYGDDLLFLHRPHPQKEAKKYQVREVAAFLTKIGVTP